MKQVYRSLDFPYNAIGFEAECGVAIIQSIRNRDGRQFSIENRRFVLNADRRNIREITSQGVGNEGDFIISGDNAKKYNESFGENVNNSFKSLECLSWSTGSNNISDDFNTFRDKLLEFYSLIYNANEMFEFRITHDETIVIRYLPKLQNLAYTIFQSTLTCETNMVLGRFNSIYENITGVRLRQFVVTTKPFSKFSKYQNLFNYLVHTFLEIYKNKEGKLLDKTVDRKAFVPLALRNTLTHIINKHSNHENFAKLLKETILENIQQQGTDLDEFDEEFKSWMQILNIYIYNLPVSLDISPINVRDNITFEIRCFEKRFLKIFDQNTKSSIMSHELDSDDDGQRKPRRTNIINDDGPRKLRRTNIINDDDDDNDTKGGGFVKKTRKRRRRTYKRSYKKRSYKKK
jgi:hypothetical protein